MPQQLLTPNYLPHHTNPRLGLHVREVDAGGEVRVKTEIATSRAKSSKIPGGQSEALTSTVLCIFYTLPFSFRKQPLFKRKMSLLLF